MIDTLFKDVFYFSYPNAHLIFFFLFFVFLKLFKSYKISFLGHVAIGYVLLANALLVSFYYWAIPNFYDHAEANSATLSWLLTQGQAIYLELNSSDRYSNLYGPTYYVLNSWIFGVFGGSFATSKALGVASFVFSIFLIFLGSKKKLGTSTAIWFSGFYSTALFLFGNKAFWARPDSMLLLGVTFWAATLLLKNSGQLNRPVIKVLFGIFAGISIGAKMHSFLYFLPMAVLLLNKENVKSLLLIFVVGAIVAFVPFADQAISFNNYFLMIRAASSQGIDFFPVFQNLGWATMASLPALGVCEFGKHNKIAWRVYYLCVLCVCLIAGKPGAGIHHIMPFFPVLWVLALSGLKTERKNDFFLTFGPLGKSAGLALIVVSLVLGAAHEFRLLRDLSKIDGKPLLKEISEINGLFPDGSVEIGYSEDGDSYRLTFFRPELLFLDKKNKVFLDLVAIAEHTHSGVKIPETTIEKLMTCPVRAWLFPKTGEPFVFPSPYPPHLNLFSDTFREAFFSAYQKTQSRQFFDIWECRYGA